MSRWRDRSKYEPRPFALPPLEVMIAAPNVTALATMLHVERNAIYRWRVIGLTAEQAAEYGLVEREIETHELRRSAYGFRPNGAEG